MHTELVEGYELLRRERGGDHAGRLPGYAVLVHRGLAAWIRVGAQPTASGESTRTTVRPTRTPLRPGGSGTSLPAGLAPDLIPILAGIALGSAEEMLHERAS